tara:strand:- start:651 stop:1586 length:936 start_codon:yes stop_codon:yes gene_type:complete
MSFKYLNTDNNSNSLNQEDAAQSFLDDKLAKNKYTIAQEDTGSTFDPSRYTAGQLNELEGNGGPKDFSSEYNKVISNQDEIDTFNSNLTSNPGGGTSRYSDYTNSNNGQTAFTDTWQDGAKYQQLRGSGNLTNKDFDAQFASSAGGADTGTVADDGGGWKLIKTDGGEKTNERKLEYKDVASQWQAAGYDVRVQDHNPDFDGGTGEIAVRVGQSQEKAPEPKEELVKIEHSPEIKQAKERVQTYENDILSGKTSEDIYGSDKYSFDATKGAAGIGTPMNGDSKEQAEKATASFLDNKKAEVKDKYQFQAQG